jgi:hypothetical protein
MENTSGRVDARRLRSRSARRHVGRWPAWPGEHGPGDLRGRTAPVRCVDFSARHRSARRP